MNTPLRGQVNAVETVESSRAQVARSRTLKVVLSIFLVAVVVACGTRDESAADAQSEKVLYVYNWADYVGEAVRNNPSIDPSEEVYRRLAIDRSWSPE